MRSLPPKMTFSQKWSYGFYDHIVDKIKRTVWVTIRNSIYTVVGLFWLGILIKAIPIIIQFFIKIVHSGIDLFY